MTAPGDTGGSTGQGPQGPARERRAAETLPGGRADREVHTEDSPVSMAWDDDDRHTNSATDKRRRWSVAEKLAVIAEASGPTTNMSAVARRHGITPTQLYRWKRDFRVGPASADLTPVHIAGLSDPADLAASLDDRLIEIHLVNGRRIKVPETIDAETLSRIIKAIDT